MSKDGRRLAEEHVATLLKGKGIALAEADSKSRDLVHIAIARGYTVDTLTEWLDAQDETVSIFDLPKVVTA